MNPETIAEYQQDLLAYTKARFEAIKGTPFKVADHHVEICNALERVVTGEITRLIINMPPRSGKTEMAVNSFISWCMGIFPDSEFIHASYSKRLAARNTYEIRATMQHEFYRQVFGTVRLAGDSQAKDEFRTDANGIVYATGADGTITGYGAGKMRPHFGGAIVIDDPHKAGEAESDVMRQNIIDWFITTMESRKNRPNTPIIIIMQRLHESDLTGWLLDGGNGEEWTLLKVPAITDDKESFWPEQFPLEMLERLEKSSPYVYAGQYLQEPAPRDGGIVKPHMIEIVDAVPAGMRMVRGWDLAATKNAGDYTVGLKMAVHEGVIYIIDLARIRGSPDEVEALIVSTTQLDGRAVKQSLPQDPAQAGKAQKTYLSRRLAGHNFVFSAESGDKLTRASPFISQVNAGNVRMLRASWNRDLVHECQLIPNGKNDDILDACTRAYNELFDGSSYSLKNL